MHTFLFSFANDHHRRLNMLETEDREINILFTPRSGHRHFWLLRDSYATTESVALNVLSHRQTLTLFHFSGHAGETVLHLENKPALGKGIAQLLSLCPNLRLVFLNGCSTQEHIQLLKEAKVRAAVIATSAPVNDQVATDFSLAFYRALVRQATLQEAIEQARLSLQIGENIQVQKIRGGFELKEINRNSWVFYSPNEETTAWELPAVPYEMEEVYKPNSLLRQSLFDALRQHNPILVSMYRKFTTEKLLSPKAIINWTNIQLLRWLPYPLAEPLRRVLCPDITPDRKTIPVTASVERLKHYVKLFDCTINLLISVYMAQIRDKLMAMSKTKNNRVALADLSVMQQLLTRGWHDLDPSELATTFESLETCCKALEIRHFIVGVSDFTNQLLDDTALRECFLFMHLLRQRLQVFAGISDVVSSCKLGEEHLTELLNWSVFWADYRLQSYKNIRAIRIYSQPPEYRHEKVVLQSYSPNDKYFLEENLPDLWECQSVLLVRTVRTLNENGELEELDRNEFLNVSPFIIDGNVFKKSDNSEFDLYDFRSFEERQLRFQHTARSDGSKKLIELDGSDWIQNEDYSLLREQVRTIHKLIKLPQPEIKPESPDDIILLPVE